MERADRVGVIVFDGNAVALVQIVERIERDERQDERYSAGRL
jgi:hypothetical protein